MGGIYLSLPGCIEEFDKLVDKLLAATESDKQSVMKEAEVLWDKTHGPRMAKGADIYVKLMRKVVATGPSFVAKEAQRVKKLLGGKISSEKKEELEEKSNILKSFSSSFFSLRAICNAVSPCMLFAAVSAPA